MSCEHGWQATGDHWLLCIAGMVRSTSCWVCLTLLKLLLMPTTRQPSRCMARRPTLTLSVSPPLVDRTVQTVTITACSSADILCEVLFNTVCFVLFGSGGMPRLSCLVYGVHVNSEGSVAIGDAQRGVHNWYAAITYRQQSNSIWELHTKGVYIVIVSKLL